MPLEIAVFTAHSAILAAKSGADRIEFCSDRSLGGITPSLTSLKSILPSMKSTPVVVMIRPRGGDFIYSPEEFEEMIESVEEFKAYVSGFVFGLLNEDGRVDKERCKELVAKVQEVTAEEGNVWSCTFHRAFDEIKDMTKGIEDVIDCGFDVILTSGGKQSAEEGVDMIGQLVGLANGRIVIMPGGGVRAENVRGLMGVVGRVGWVHSSAVLEGDEVDGDEVERLVCAIGETFE